MLASDLLRTLWTSGCLLAISVAAVAQSLETAPRGIHTSAIERDAVIAGGGESDFAEVRHLVLRGSNFEIGRALAGVARDRFKIPAPRADDPLRSRARAQFMERNDPVFFDRMRGAAAAFGLELEDTDYDFSALGYQPLDIGCSVVYYPPEHTADGNGLLSRNYDFSTGMLDGSKPAEGMLGSTARPFLVELHPDAGFASLAMYSYDLLGGVIDGINEEGLTVAILADDELTRTASYAPTRGVGLGVLGVPRYLLDHCANVEEAKLALLQLPQYYSAIPCHYLIADRHGESFVWESGHHHQQKHIFDGGEWPQIITNFSLHRHLEPGVFPQDPAIAEVCWRYAHLQEQVLAHPGGVDRAQARQIQSTVACDRERWQIRPDGIAHRTLWYAQYVPEERSLAIDFYLREGVEEDAPNVHGVRSSVLTFQLHRGAGASGGAPQ